MCLYPPCFFFSCCSFGYLCCSAGGRGGQFCFRNFSFDNSCCTGGGRGRVFLNHRWAHLLKQQSLTFIVCRPRKINFHFPFLFAENKWKFAVSVFHLQQTNRNCCFPLVLFCVCGIPETWRHGEKETWRYVHEHGYMELDIEAWT
jgi:hypothetical protein